ncbi:50S ribosomal protein L3 [Candidatus Gracilibacteria bacterium]|nr:50S ribosomal protein L3 [Candidatus Gracilibacteria bacterium]
MMSNKGGIVVQKKEMTRVWDNEKQIPVTVVKILQQEIVRYKDQDKDGYISAVVGVEKKELKKEKGKKIDYKMMTEFKVDDSFVQQHEVGKIIDESLLDEIKTVTVVGYSKGKGYQGAMKRFNLDGGPKTHGSKFHRHVGSMGNRKPRRTLKGHPHAGQMGYEKITLKKINVIDFVDSNNEKLIIVKGSLPGTYNGLLKFIIE